MQARLRTEAKCLRVIDGDTILCRLICPCCKIESEQRVRLARIDAPELRGPQQHLARCSRDRLRELVQGKKITVSVTRSWPDKYGRVLAEVSIDDINVSNWMQQRGLAKWYTPEPGPGPGLVTLDCVTPDEFQQIITIQDRTTDGAAILR